MFLGVVSNSNLARALGWRRRRRGAGRQTRLTGYHEFWWKGIGRGNPVAPLSRSERWEYLGEGKPAPRHESESRWVRPAIAC